MDKEELVLELINFLNENGEYYNFVNFAQDKGYSEEEVDSVITKVEEGE